MKYPHSDSFPIIPEIWGDHPQLPGTIARLLNNIIATNNVIGALVIGRDGLVVKGIGPIACTILKNLDDMLPTVSLNGRQLNMKGGEPAAVAVEYLRQEEIPYIVDGQFLINGVPMVTAIIQGEKHVETALMFIQHFQHHIEQP